jgi:hypothetical protein
MNSNLEVIKQRWRGKDAEDIFTLISEVERLRETVTRLFETVVSMERKNSISIEQTKIESREEERLAISEWIKNSALHPELAEKIRVGEHAASGSLDDIETFASSIQKISGE